MIDDLALELEKALLIDAELPSAAVVPGATLYVREGVDVGADRPFTCVIGAFDGLHIGHRALIDAAREEAAARHLPLALATFVPDPSEVLSKRNPEHLSCDDDRIMALSLADPDLIIAFDFTWDFSRNSYDAFVLDVLGSIVAPASIHVGEDFTFGADGAGSPADIARLGAIHGFSSFGHTLIEKDGVAVSSTHIRELIKAGCLTKARELLGHLYMMRAYAQVEQGSAALSFDTRSCMPKTGAYACFIAVEGTAYPAVIDIDADACRADVRACALTLAAQSCSVVYMAPIPDSDDSYPRMWVQQDEICLDTRGWARDQR